MSCSHRRASRAPGRTPLTFSIGISKMALKRQQLVGTVNIDDKSVVMNVNRGRHQFSLKDESGLCTTATNPRNATHHILDNRAPDPAPTTDASRRNREQRTRNARNSHGVATTGRARRDVLEELGNAQKVRLEGLVQLTVGQRSGDALPVANTWCGRQRWRSPFAPGVGGISAAMAAPEHRARSFSLRCSRACRGAPVLGNSSNENVIERVAAFEDQLVEALGS
jgi:hypothetical protein